MNKQPRTPTLNETPKSEAVEQLPPAPGDPRYEAIARIQQSISTLVRAVQHPGVADLVSTDARITIGGPHHQALTRIIVDGPITVTKMAKDLAADPSTLSRHIAALERRGLVKRVPDASDGRSSNLTATDYGNEIFALLLAEWVNTIGGVVADWSEQAIVGFSDAFADFVDRMGVIVDDSIAQSEQNKRL